MIEIRKAKPEEYPIYDQLGKSSFPDGHGVFSQETPEVLTYLKDYEKKHGKTGGVFVGIDREIVGGVCIRKVTPKEFRLNHLVVRRNYQRRGGGKFLIEFATNLILEKFPKAKITVKTDSDYAQLSLFWEKLGFELVDTLPHWTKKKEEIFLLEYQKKE